MQRNVTISQEYIIGVPIEWEQLSQDDLVKAINSDIGMNLTDSNKFLDELGEDNDSHFVGNYLTHIDDKPLDKPILLCLSNLIDDKNS